MQNEFRSNRSREKKGWTGALGRPVELYTSVALYRTLYGPYLVDVGARFFN